MIHWIRQTLTLLVYLSSTCLLRTVDASYPYNYSTDKPLLYTCHNTTALTYTAEVEVTMGTTNTLPVNTAQGSNMASTASISTCDNDCQHIVTVVTSSQTCTALLTTEYYDTDTTTSAVTTQETDFDNTALYTADQLATPVDTILYGVDSMVGGVTTTNWSVTTSITDESEITIDIKTVNWQRVKTVTVVTVILTLPSEDETCSSVDSTVTYNTRAVCALIVFEDNPASDPVTTYSPVTPTTVEEGSPVETSDSPIYNSDGVLTDGSVTSSQRYATTWTQSVVTLSYTRTDEVTYNYDNKVRLRLETYTADTVYRTFIDLYDETALTIPILIQIWTYAPSTLFKDNRSYMTVGYEEAGHDIEGLVWFFTIADTESTAPSSFNLVDMFLFKDHNLIEQNNSEDYMQTYKVDDAGFQIIKDITGDFFNFSHLINLGTDKSFVIKFVPELDATNLTYSKLLTGIFVMAHNSDKVMSYTMTVETLTNVATSGYFSATSSVFQSSTVVTSFVVSSTQYVMNPGNNAICSSITFLNTGTSHLQFSKVVPLGYPYCTVTAIKEESSVTYYEIYGSDEELAVTPTSLTRTWSITYQIDDNPDFQNDDFCMMGLQHSVTLYGATADYTATTQLTFDNKLEVTISLDPSDRHSTITFDLNLSDKRDTSVLTTPFTSVSNTQEIRSCVFWLVETNFNTAAQQQFYIGDETDESTYYQNIQIEWDSLNYCTKSEITYSITMSDGATSYDSTDPASTFAIRNSNYPDSADSSLNNGVILKYGLAQEYFALHETIYTFFVSFSVSYTLTGESTVRTDTYLSSLSQMVEFLYPCYRTTLTFVTVPAITAQTKKYKSDLAKPYSLDADETALYLDTYEETFTISDDLHTLAGQFSADFCGEYELNIVHVTTPNEIDELLSTIEVVADADDFTLFTLRVQLRDISISYATEYLFDISVWYSDPTFVSGSYGSVTMQTTVTGTPCLVDQAQFDYDTGTVWFGYDLEDKPNGTGETVIQFSMFPQCGYSFIRTYEVTSLRTDETADPEDPDTEANYGVTVSDITTTGNVHQFSASAYTENDWLGDSWYDNKLNRFGQNYTIGISIAFINNLKQVANTVVYEMTVVYYFDLCKKTWILDSDYNFTAQEPLRNSILGGTTLRSFMEYPDYVSSYWGNGQDPDGFTKCGSRYYSIKQKNQDFLTVNQERLLTLESSSRADEGNHAMTLLVSLTDYDEYIQYPAEYTINVIISACVFTQEPVPSLDTQIVELKVGVGKVLFPLIKYTQTPACNYTIVETRVMAQSPSSEITIPDEDITDEEGAIGILVGGIEYEGKNVTFFLENIFDDPDSTRDDSLQFIVQLVKASFIDIKDRNTEPKFVVSDLEIPLAIPCKEDEAFETWEYIFPEIYDPENHPFTVNFNPDEELEGLLVFEYISLKKMRLILNRKGNIPVPIQFYYGLLKATDYYGKSMIEKFQFTIQCMADIEIDERLRTGYHNNETMEGLNQPVPAVTTMSREGLLVISFSQDLLVPSNFVQLESGTFWTLSGVHPMFEIQIIPGEDQDPNLLSFTWHIESFTARELRIGLTFENPRAISFGSTPDTLKVIFWAPYLFLGAETKSHISAESNLQVELKRQLILSSASAPNMSAIAQASLLALVISIIFSFVIKSIMDRLLGVIRSLSIITHMTLISVLYPKNVTEFFGQIFDLVSFDIFYTENLYNWMFQWENKAFSEAFGALGYYSSYTIANLGSLAAMTLLVPVLVLVVGFFNRYLPFWRCLHWWRIGQRVQQYIDSNRKALFWNEIILFINETYLVLAVSVFLNMETPLFKSGQTKGELFNDIYTIVSLIVVLIFPIFILVLYKKKLKKREPDFQTLVNFRLDQVSHLTPSQRDEIVRNCYTPTQHKLFLETYGVLLQDMNIKRAGHNVCIALVVGQIMRRLVLAVVLVFFTDHPFVIVISSNFTQLAIIMTMMYWRPYKASDGFVFNEICILISNYHFFCLTDFVRDPDTKIWIGDRLIQFTIINMGINFLVAGYLSVWVPASRKVKKAQLKLTHNKKMNKIRKQRQIEAEKKRLIVEQKKREEVELKRQVDLANELFPPEPVPAHLRVPPAFDINHFSNFKQSNFAPVKLNNLKQHDFLPVKQNKHQKILQNVTAHGGRNQERVTQDVSHIQSNVKLTQNQRVTLAKELEMRSHTLPLSAYTAKLNELEQDQREEESKFPNWHLPSKLPKVLTHGLASEVILIKRAQALKKRKLQWDALKAELMFQ